MTETVFNSAKSLMNWTRWLPLREGISEQRVHPHLQHSAYIDLQQRVHAHSLAAQRLSGFAAAFPSSLTVILTCSSVSILTCNTAVILTCSSVYILTTASMSEPDLEGILGVLITLARDAGVMITSANPSTIDTKKNCTLLAAYITTICWPSAHSFRPCHWNRQSCWRHDLEAASKCVPHLLVLPLLRILTLRHLSKILTYSLQFPRGGILHGLLPARRIPYIHRRPHRRDYKLRAQLSLRLHLPGLRQQLETPRWRRLQPFHTETIHCRTRQGRIPDLRQNPRWFPNSFIDWCPPSNSRCWVYYPASPPPWPCTAPQGSSGVPSHHRMG